jgi:hypothetical protein
MNVICNGVDIGCTGFSASPIHDQMEWVSIDGSRKSPPRGKYSVRLEFTGPVGYDMPTEGVHSFEVLSPTGRHAFRAEADHFKAHKQTGSRVVSLCPNCGGEECCSAVWEQYELDVPAKTYWNVLNPETPTPADRHGFEPFELTERN